MVPSECTEGYNQLPCIILPVRATPSGQLPPVREERVRTLCLPLRYYFMGPDTSHIHISSTRLKAARARRGDPGCWCRQQLTLESYSSLLVLERFSGWREGSLAPVIVGIREVCGILK